MKSLAYRIGYVIGFVTTVLVVAGFVFLLATWALWFFKIVERSP